MTDRRVPFRFVFSFFFIFLIYYLPFSSCPKTQQLLWRANTWGRRGRCARVGFLSYARSSSFCLSVWYARARTSRLDLFIRSRRICKLISERSVNDRAVLRCFLRAGQRIFLCNYGLSYRHSLLTASRVCPFVRSRLCLQLMSDGGTSSGLLTVVAFECVSLIKLVIKR